MNKPKKLWSPSKELVETSNLTDYVGWLKKNKHISFNDYQSLWNWSVENLREFWESLISYFEIHFHVDPKNIQSDDPMPETRWFDGAALSYAEHIFRNRTDHHPAIIFKQEQQEAIEISWKELEQSVARLADYFRSLGLRKGDRIVAFLPNIPEATIGFLATNSIGAIWSSCSPDFGSSSVVDRFRQIEPKLLLTVDGYQYNGKPFDRKETVIEIIRQLPSIKNTIVVPYLEQLDQPFLTNDAVSWDQIMRSGPKILSFEPVNFEDPIWILYSSGTTGQPKAITHSTGGMLLEHLKYIVFHNDVKPGDRYFWFTTTGWMMWNFVQATLLAGATIVLYDGSPAVPDISGLWCFAEQARITHFGTSAPFIIACMKNKLKLTDVGFDALKSISSTGAPLPPEGFDWIYNEIKKDVWLVSMSGGTDICSAFVGGCPWEPVYQGEIQCRTLGCDLDAFDESGNPIVNEVGEMVIKQPMPCMPIYFWNDENKVRYNESYFDVYPGIWRHGDWVMITARQTLIIMGRSDATLNRHGVRIGTAEIYREVDKLLEIKDSLIINIEHKNGSHYMPLFVVMQPYQELNEAVIGKIKSSLKRAYSPRHVPDEIIAVKDIPYTISGKKMETPVKKIYMGLAKDEAANLGAMRNPDSLGEFVQLAKMKGTSEAG